MRRVFEANPDTTTQLQDAALAKFDTFTDPFSITAYGQNRAIRELFNPVEVVVSQKICWVKRGRSRVMSIVVILRKKAADTGSLLTHFICLALGLLSMKQMERNCIISRME